VFSRFKSRGIGRRGAFVSIACSTLLLGGCVQLSLDDLGEPSRQISPAVVSAMQAKGMTQEGSVLIRIFKMESELEVWKSDASGRYALLKTYPICRWSGKLGPKTKSGDRQAPEGFYRVSRGMLNPRSEFFLSFNLGYPNRLESALGYSGEALMVHGACSSSGCFALTDQGVGEIYALLEKALAAGQKTVQVQSYPFRMSPRNLAEHRNDPNMGFWRDLKTGYDIFEVERREPKVSMCGGRYVFDANFPGGEPSNPLKACPARSDSPDSLVIARQAADDRSLATLSVKSRESSPYQDGGMHFTFRTLLRKNGEKKLAAKVSQINYPVSRPAAALADPYQPGR
jgi:murein L,D-transpeptidase YafK